MKPAVIEDNIFEFEPFEEDGSVQMAAETPMERRYFESTTDAFEVLIFTGRKEISIKRNIATSNGFLKMLMKSFRK